MNNISANLSSIYRDIYFDINGRKGGYITQEERDRARKRNRKNKNK